MKRNMPPQVTIKLEPGLVAIKQEPNPDKSVEVELTPALGVPTFIKQELLSPKKECPSPIIEQKPAIGRWVHRPIPVVKNTKPPWRNTFKMTSRCYRPHSSRRIRTRYVSNSCNVVSGKHNKWKQNCLFKIGIWDKYLMSKDKLEKLKRSLLIEFMKCPDSRAPSFYESVDQNGWLQISLKSKDSFDWVCLILSLIKPWPDCNFTTKLCDVNNEWNITLSVNTNLIKTGNEFVALLKKQNQGLGVDEWGMTCVRYFSDRMKVDFTLTEDQINELRQVNYDLTVGFSKVNVELQPNKVNTPSERVNVQYNRNQYINPYYWPGYC